MRADPADPGGMGSTGPAIEDGVVTLSVRSLCVEQRERRGAPHRAERYVTIARASVPARVIGPPGRVMCVPGPRRAEAGGPHRAPGGGHVSDGLKKGGHAPWKSPGQGAEGTFKRR